MNVTYYPVGPYPQSTCGVCLESLTENVVAHDPDEALGHPLHELCAKQWVAVRPSCPSSMLPVDVPNSFLPYTTWNHVKRTFVYCTPDPTMLLAGAIIPYGSILPIMETIVRSKAYADTCLVITTDPYSMRDTCSVLPFVATILPTAMIASVLFAGIFEYGKNTIDRWRR